MCVRKEREGEVKYGSGSVCERNNKISRGAWVNDNDLRMGSQKN